jgi:UDP-N-acetylglucosamine--N-acetylmuramyl-(pentapeptide) pyrophosphoryl-undecaprenol N-acetylglucosamine transferase
VVITAGGTAGHANPALAVAQELRHLGLEVHFAGTPQGIEARLVEQEGFPFVAFAASGFNRVRPWTLLTSSFVLQASAHRAQKWLQSLRPQVVVGFGGYASIPVGLAASRLGIPLAIHEQNSRPGMANRFLARRAQLVALTYGAAGERLRSAGETVQTGNPVRASLLGVDPAAARASFGIPANASVLLAFGGSLGARHLNEALFAQADRLLAHENLHVLHISGTRDYESARTRLAKGSYATRWHLLDYCDRMGEAYAAADLVLSRAGATSLAELAALAKPALLIPYPHAAADEQTANACNLVRAGGARMLADAELDTPRFVETLEELLLNAAERSRMSDALRTLGGATARQELARLIIALAEADTSS